ncbi:MAG TPA: hypothetical protein VMJ10_19305 [Kofleriaceae bacterium]|nr:hypothetical protein [Kofleriaceae bacterium]
MSRAIGVALACALAAHVAPASAQPRTDPTVGRAVFTGATTPNATSIELDPAALVLGKSDEFYFSATSVIDRLSIQTRTIDLATGALGTGPDVSATTLSPGGTVAWVPHIQAGSVAVGLALSSMPISAAPTGVPALQYHVLDLRERAYTGTFGASIRLADWLLFGASLSYEARHLHLRYARDVALASGTGLGNPADTEIVDVQVHEQTGRLFNWLIPSTDNLSANLGVIVQFSKDAAPSLVPKFVGVAYHTVPGVDSVTNELDGNAVVTQAPSQGGQTVHGAASVVIAEPTVVDGEVRWRIPHDFDLHLGARWEDLSRFSAYDVRAFGTGLAAIGVPEWTERPLGYHDPLAVWIGAEQVDVGDIEPLRFGARIGFQTSALPDAATSPMAIAPFSYTLDLGGQLRLRDRPWLIQATVGVQYFPTVTVADSAYDPRDLADCVASGYNYSLPACASTRNGYAIDTAAGDYSRFELALRLALHYEY